MKLLDQSFETICQQWYEDRLSALSSFRVEADKRTRCNEWLKGEDPKSYISEKLTQWVLDNPYPIKQP